MSQAAATIERVQDDLEQVADRLDDIVEQLAELGMAALREALEDTDGDGKRPDIEKRISRARRSAEKAAVLLRNSHSNTII